MTHDELLEKIKWDLKTGIDGGLKGSIKKDFQSALRAVVELHTRILDPVGRPECLSCRRHYPCPTIQAIEKKLG